MKLTIYGPGCSKCNQVKKNVEQAVKELELTDVDVSANQNQFDMLKKGITDTPALTFNDVLKCLGRVPDVDEIKGWLR